MKQREMNCSYFLNSQTTPNQTHSPQCKMHGFFKVTNNHARKRKYKAIHKWVRFKSD